MSVLGRISIRGRLTLFYVGLLSLALIGYAAGASAFLLHNLREQLDHRLNADVETIEGMFAWVGPDRIQPMTQNLDEELARLAVPLGGSPSDDGRRALPKPANIENSINQSGININFGRGQK